MFNGIEADRRFPKVGKETEGSEGEGTDRRSSVSACQRLANGLAGDVSLVGAGVSELRIHYGPGYRVYFQRRGDTIIVLLCGGDKGSQIRDIAAAKRLAEHWDE